MAITVGAPTGHDFNSPLGLLSDCHRRIEKFLGAIIAVAEAANGGVLSDEQKSGLETALRYFRQAAPLHTADEEVSLFPRLRACDNAEVRAALAQVEGLEADHKQVDAGHQVIDTLAEKWLTEGRLAEGDVTALRDQCERLRSIYSGHIALEDDVIFPLAGRTLDANALAAVGREMARRRGLDPDAPNPLGRCTERRMVRESKMARDSTPFGV